MNKISKFSKRMFSFFMVVLCLSLIASCVINDDCEHKWGEWITTEEATCTETGLKEHECSKCGKKETSSIDALGHDWEEATCTSPKTCKVCNETEGSAKGHSFILETANEKALKSVATCDSAAVYYKSCACGAISTSDEDTFTVGNALDHIDEDKNHACDHECGTNLGTCEDLNKDHLCDYGCGKVFGVHADSSTDNDHLCDYGCGEVLEECSDVEGDHDHTCDVCGKTDVTEHNFGSATCEHPETCSECNTIRGEKLEHLDENKDHVCDYGCGKNDIGEHSDSADDDDHLCDYGCGAVLENCFDSDSDHDHDCDVCGKANITLHDYVLVEELSVAATCTSPAIHTYRCDCGDEYEESYGDALGHNITGVTPEEGLVEGCEYVLVYICQRENCCEEVHGEHIYHHHYVATIKQAATCCENGVKSIVCEDCGHEKDAEVIPANSTGHNWVAGVVVDGVRTDECSICHETKTVTVYEGNTTDAINASDLADKEIELNDANISLDNGVIDTIGDQNITVSADKLEGENRNEIGLDNEQLQQVGDNPIYNFTINNGTDNISDFGENNWVTITLPYVLSEGEDVDSVAVWFISDHCADETCTDGDACTNVAHRLVSISATYNNGYVTFKTNHFSYYTVTKLTPAERCALYGHGYVHQHVEGSCTQDSYDLYVCVRCHDRYIDQETYVVADGHNYVEDTHAATCTESGYITYTCSDCDHSYTVKVNATGHSWEVNSSEEATCTADGHTTYRCTKCDEEYTIIIPKLSHIYVDTVVSATCTTDGYTLHKCEKCEYSFVDNFVSALGHAYASTTWSWNADYSAATLTFVCEHDSEHVVVRDAIVEVLVVTGTCSNFVKTTYTATVIYDGMTYSDVKVVEEGTPDHKFADEWEKDEYEHWHECVCGEKTDIAEHTFENEVVTKEPTCSQPGESVSTCVCGATKVTVIPATGEHNYQDGVCVDCGSEYVDVYFINLLNTWKNIDSFALHIENLTLVVKEQNKEGEYNLIGSIQQVDIIELILYVENGELKGGFKGSVEIFNGPVPDDTSVVVIKAIIENNNVYVTFEYTVNAIVHRQEIIYSLDALVENILNGVLNLDSNSMMIILDFVKNTLLPVIDKLVDSNSEKINALLEKLFNMVFTFEKQENGTVNVTLDFDKLYELSANITSKTIKEFIDHYFGEGSFDGLVNDIIYLANLEVHSIPAALENLGVDLEVLYAGINDFARKMGAPEDFDIESIIMNEELQGLTLGMIIFQTEDNSYLEMINYIVSILEENCLCELILGNTTDAPTVEPDTENVAADEISCCDEVKAMIDSVIEMLSNMVSVSFTTDKSGTITSASIDVSVNDFNVSEYSTISVSFGIDIEINSDVDITWTDIIDEIEANVVLPTSDMLDLFMNVDYHPVENGVVTYKGNEYPFAFGVYVEVSNAEVDKLSYMMISPDCHGWMKYDANFAKRINQFLLVTIEVDGQSINLIVDRLSGTVVEMRQTETGYLAIYEDGTETVIEFSAEEMESEYAIAILCLKAMPNAEYVINYEGLHISYLYNSTLNEYAFESQHELEQSYELLGESCEDGVIVTEICTKCDYYNQYKRWYCNSEQVTIDLAEHSACGGSITAYKCNICGEIKHVINMAINCQMVNEIVEDILDENGNVIGSKRTMTCSECGLVFVSGIWTEALSSCSYKEFTSIIILNGEACIFEYVNESYFASHQYEYTYELQGDSCEDGVAYHAICKLCGDNYEGYFSHHETHTIFRLDEEYGCCENHFIEVFGCPCGEHFDYKYNEFGLEYDEKTQTYICNTCGLMIKNSYEEKNEGCITYYVNTLEIKVNDKVLYSLVNEQSRQNHNFSQVSVTTENCVYLVKITCSKCGESHISQVNNVTLENHNGEYYYDYEFTPEVSGYYTINGLAENDTRVELFILSDGNKQIGGDDDSGYGNQFLLCQYLEAGVTYVYRISFYNRDNSGTIAFAMANSEIRNVEDTKEICNVSVLLEGSESCEDGALVILVDYTSGNLLMASETHEHITMEKTRVNISNYGACYGEYIYHSCACGAEHYIELYSCCDSYNSNEYVDEEGHLVSVEVSSCSSCGLRYEKISYEVEDLANCQVVEYISVLISINGTIIIDEQYEISRKQHDYEITSELFEGATSCEDGVVVTYRCKTCGLEKVEEAHHHILLEKEVIDLLTLGSVCGGTATLYECPCGHEGELTLDHLLCDMDNQSCSIWVENIISGSQYTISGTNIFRSTSYMMVCAVTDPACRFVIRYAEYWLKDENSCSVSQYRTWQLGYDEETDTCIREITVKSGWVRDYHNYVDNSTENNYTYDCPDCGSYYHQQYCYNDDSEMTKHEIEIANTLNNGYDQYRLTIEEYAKYEDTSYVSRSYTKTISTDGTEYWRETIRSKEEYIAPEPFENGLLTRESSSSSYGESVVFEKATGLYCNYVYELYEYRKDEKYWSRYDYSYSFENQCIRTTTLTDSYGQKNVYDEECCHLYRDEVLEETCTQDGAYCNECYVCNYHSEEYVINPHGHSWRSGGGLGYYCTKCGMENANGADGSIILEDLTRKYGNGENYVVGYFEATSVEFTHYISLVLDDDSIVDIIDNIEIIQLENVRAFAFSRVAVETWATENGYADYKVRFTFVPVGSDGNFDYSITFTEPVEIITDSIKFVDFIGAGEEKYYVITPTVDSKWIFQSTGDSDTKAYLYNADGTQLVYSDDDGKGSNFLIEYDLEAGQTYTLKVMFYSDSRAEYVPLDFEWVPLNVAE